MPVPVFAAILRTDKARVRNMTDNETLQLPVDIIIHIMTYLSASDRMSAGLVNRTWREASLAMKFVDRQILFIGWPRTNMSYEILNVLQHSTRPFYHFVFREMDLKRSMPIWDQYGPHMKTLVLISCDLTEKTLVNILKCCAALRVLHIMECQECLMSGILLEDENDVKEIAEKFQHLQELGLCSNRYLSDALFNRLVAIGPNIDSLSLMGCLITFHHGVYKKFYPQGCDTSNACKSLLTFLNIVQYLKRQTGKLKHLNFGYTHIDSSALATLSALEGLRLESLIIEGCSQVTNAGIKELTQHQTSLKVLDISSCAQLTDDSLLYISTGLKKLEVLRLKKCWKITNNGVRHIRLLRNLKELDISHNDRLTGNCITRGLCCELSSDLNSPEDMNLEEDQDIENVNPNSPELVSTPAMYLRNENMKVFYANSIPGLHRQSIERISMCFPNLRVLELNACFTAVTDKSIQVIFKELVHLRTLTISHCDKISDAGLTGMGLANDEDHQQAQAESESEYSQTRYRISLRSRAEEEIVRDAERKREIMKLCETIPEPSDLNSLLRLRSLQNLNLSGCEKISDVSLKYAFAFPELQILNLSRCQQITDVGLDYLSRNNPAIEHLNLKMCHNISDVGVSYLAQRLHRLRRLLIQGCSQLTDQSIKSIKSYCRNLRYLDTRYCRGMTVAGMESLSHLYVDWVRHIDDVQDPAPPPNAPPMPPATFLPQGLP